MVTLFIHITDRVRTWVVRRTRGDRSETRMGVQFDAQSFTEPFILLNLLYLVEQNYVALHAAITYVHLPSTRMRSSAAASLICMLWPMTFQYK